MYYEQPRKELFGVCDIMYVHVVLFRNAIPLQNNGKLQANMNKFLIYYSNRMHNFLYFCVISW